MWITRTCTFRMRLKQLLLYFRQTWCTKTFMTTSMWMTDRTSVDSYIGPWTLHRWCLDSPHMLTQVGHFQWQSRFPLYLHGISFRILSLELSSPDSFSKQLVCPRLSVATEGLCIIALGPVSSALHYSRYLRSQLIERKRLFILFHSLEGFSPLTVDPLLLGIQEGVAHYTMSVWQNPYLASNSERNKKGIGSILITLAVVATKHLTKAA